jgi:hypothetical protein
MNGLSPAAIVGLIVGLCASFLLLSSSLMSLAMSDMETFPEFSRRAQSAREAAFLVDSIMGLADNDQGDPHAGDASPVLVDAVHANALALHHADRFLPGAR